MMNDLRDPPFTVESNRNTNIAAAIIVAIGFGTIAILALSSGTGASQHVSAPAVAANRAAAPVAASQDAGSTAPASDSLPGNTETVAPSPPPEVVEKTAADRATATSPVTADTAAKPVKVARVQRKLSGGRAAVSVPNVDRPAIREEAQPAPPEVAPQQTTAVPADPPQEKVSADPPQENPAAVESQATPTETAPQ